MAGSFKEIGYKAEGLIEKGERAKQNVCSCQAAVTMAYSMVAEARKELDAIGRDDNRIDPIGDMEKAEARLKVVEYQLEASQRALTAALEDVGGVNLEKRLHVQEIEMHNQVERSNLEKLRGLRSDTFGADAAALTEGIAQRLNEAEDARVELLYSMGICVAPDYVTVESGGGTDFGYRGGGFSTLDTSEQTRGCRDGSSERMAFGFGIAAPVGGALGDRFGVPDAEEIQDQLISNSQNGEIQSAPKVGNHTGNANGSAFDEKYYNKASSILSDNGLPQSQKFEMLNELRNQMISTAQIEASRLEARAIKENLKVLRLTDNEKREMGTRYIERMLDVYRDNLLERGVREGKDPDDIISELRVHYSGELEKEIAGLPNQLYEDPNYDCI